MGTAIRPLLDIDGSVVEAGAGWWLGLSGLPSADLNMALTDSASDHELLGLLGRIEAVGCPALLMLAADAKAAELPEPWTRVGAMPIMTADLADTPRLADSRVRLGGPQDVTPISTLMSDAYGIDRPLIEIVVDHVIKRSDANKLWLLVDEGEPVSTVMSARVQDTVSLWCMATPPRFARRGFGRALLASVLDWATQDGATAGLLGATPAGEPLYRATGWTEIETWEIALNAQSAQFS